MSGKKKYTIWVAVHKDETSDFSKFRHAALWFVPREGQHYYYHVVGSSGAFRFEQRKNFNPTATRSFAAKFEVGKTAKSLSSAELAHLMTRVPVDNNNYEFNCHQWVEQALLMLHIEGYLSEELYVQGYNGMLDLVMEAEDESIAF